MERGVWRVARHDKTMTDEPRESEVRVNSTDLRYLKTAKEELDYDLPLGRVAREGAKELITSEESDDGAGVHL